MSSTRRRQESYHAMLSHNGTTDVGQNHRGTGSMVNDERDCTNHSQQNPRGTKKMAECGYEYAQQQGLRSSDGTRTIRWGSSIGRMHIEEVEKTTGLTLENIYTQELKPTMDNQIIKETNGHSMGHVATPQ